MKTALTIVLTFIFSLSYGQEFKDIYFISGNTGKLNLTVYLNDILIGTMGKNEVLHYEVMSEGLLSGLVITDHSRNHFSVQVKKGDTKYIKLFLNAWNGQLTSKELDAEEGKSELESIDKILNKKEDVENPIGKLPESYSKQGPKQGTGFLINSEGYVLTNFHVVEDAESIKVIGVKGDFSVPFEARLVAVDRLSDLALLKIETKLITFSSPPYQLSDSKNSTKAERIFALGYPLEGAMGSEVKITDGIINSLSGFKKSISEFQISAAVQQGNSGGPLFNSKGEVIGIVSAKIRSDLADQVGYAIKSNYILFFLKESGITQFETTENQLEDKSLSEQVEAISDFIYVIKTE